jgi:hypothetical protein
MERTATCKRLVCRVDVGQLITDIFLFAHTVQSLYDSRGHRVCDHMARVDIWGRLSLCMIPNNSVATELSLQLPLVSVYMCGDLLITI